MVKFGEKMKGAFLGAREKVQDTRTISKFKNADLCHYQDAWRIVYPEFEAAIGRKTWSVPAVGQTLDEYKEEIQGFLSRIWPDEYEPQKIAGSVASIFNLTIIYLVCYLKIPSQQDKFFKTLEWAIDQSSMEDIWPYFEGKLFGDNPATENLMTLLPRYAKENFPEKSIEEILSKVNAKLSRLNRINSNNSTLIFDSKGLRDSTIERGSGPQGSLLRYIEMYSPERLEEEYLSPLFNLHPSLKPDTKQQYMHWLFCTKGVLLVPDKNNRSKPIWIPSKKIHQLVFGLAYDALTENGIAKYESYKLFMYTKLEGQEPSILYQYLGNNREKAFISLTEFENGAFSVLEDFYPVDWTEEIIDESSHYTRTTTTTTYWTWG